MSFPFPENEEGEIALENEGGTRTKEQGTKNLSACFHFPQFFCKAKGMIHSFHEFVVLKGLQS